MRIVFEELSSWTPLTMYLGMRQHFRPNIYKANISGFLFFEFAFSSITLKILNPHNKSPNKFALYICLVSNVVPRYIVKGVQDDIS